MQAEQGAPPDRGQEADRASGRQRALAAAGERPALGSIEAKVVVECRSEAMT
jgi:hypothetical protein